MPEPNWVIAAATIALVLTGFFQWRAILAQGLATEQAVRAAERNADTARKTLVLSRRAWVNVEASIAGPLRFDDNGAYIHLTPRLENIGNLVATRITFHARLDAVIAGVGFPSPEQQRRFSDDIREMKHKTVQLLLFPSEEFCLTDASSPEGAYSHQVRVDQQDIERALVAQQDHPSLTLCVSMCVDYTFPSDPDNYHQTQLIYEIRRKASGRIHPDDGPINADDLVLRHFALGAFRYAD